MKKFIGLLTSFSLLLAISCATPGKTPVYVPNEKAKLVNFQRGSEPDGFNGIKWQTELSNLKGMIYYRADYTYGGIDFYVKTGDWFNVENGRIRPVQYGFWKGKLYVGMVTTKGLSDWNVLKKTVFKKFGEGAKPFRNIEEYLWIGKDAVMALKYDESSGMGTYYIRCTSMMKQMEKAQLWPDKKPE
jgi:hypothetical protein